MESVHLPTLEAHLQDAPRYISFGLMHFYEGFHGIFNSKSFHLYDQQLFARIEKVHDLWTRSLSFFQHYQGDLREGCVFSARRPIWTKEQETDWADIVATLNKLNPALDDLLLDVRERYLEI